VTITTGKRLAGVVLMTGSAAANQFGAATAALAFPVLGPAGVVAVRQWVAGVLLLVTVRPKFTAMTWSQWRPVIALALIFATMNLSLYTAVSRIGLGLAVTLEFLGPLSVALLASRRRADLGCAALTGLIVLGQSLRPADWLAIAAVVTANAVSIGTGTRKTACPRDRGNGEGDAQAVGLAGGGAGGAVMGGGDRARDGQAKAGAWAR
jgi:inner membrane transporter RhtA